MHHRGMPLAVKDFINMGADPVTYFSVTTLAFAVFVSTWLVAQDGPDKVVMVDGRPWDSAEVARDVEAAAGAGCRLVESDEVFAIAGSLGTPTNMAAAPTRRSNEAAGKLSSTIIRSV